MEEFLSTPSARRATNAGVPAAQLTGDFYPRPPRGGRHHAAVPVAEPALFLSTPSARRATGVPGFAYFHNPISIHALREEGDGCHHTFKHFAREFLSTPSARRATLVVDAVLHQKVFLSTPSARRATQCQRYAPTGSAISIHALREEGDVCAKLFVVVGGRFLSTPSARRATMSIV